MNRAKFTLLTAALCGGVGAMAAEPQRPNLVFLLADQLRADALGCAGNEQAITPNIDAFAESSFNLANAVSVSPVSAPYRSSLLTGKYISSTGMVINEINMNLNHDFFAEVLSENGYNCGYVGKMHLNDQHIRPNKKGAERFGFDHFWAGYSFGHKSWESYYYTDDEDGNEIKVDQSGKYGPEEFTTITCDYIERASKEDKPFAVFLSWNPPHDPWTDVNVKPECYNKFEDVEFELPENFNPTPDPYMDRYPRPFFKNEKEWNMNYMTGEGFQETMRCYYSMVNSIDEQTGRVLDKLEELGIDDNTIVVFTTDHGEMFGSQGRMYKMIFYDEAARVPMYIRYPDAVRRGKSDVCINTPDLMPTLLGLMGLEKEIPAEVEGSDLSFVLRGERGEEPEYAFMQGMGHTFIWRDGYEWRSVRDKRYSYARYLRDGKELLFDLKRDPRQTKNLADDPKNEKLVAKYRDMMADKMEQLGDEFKPCTWYRDNWMYRGYSIKESATGVFGPIAPLTPYRGQPRSAAKK